MSIIFLAALIAATIFLVGLMVAGAYFWIAIVRRFPAFFVVGAMLLLAIWHPWR